MLSKYIIKTISYYDVLNYPLTAFEIWKHLLISEDDPKKMYKFSLEDVENCLDEMLEKKDYIDNFQGLFFLKNRKNLVEERRIKEKISSQKLKKILKVAKIFSFSPFVDFVGVVGRVGMKNSQEKSDIDVLVFLSPGRIFLGRFFLTIIIHFFRLRRHKDKIVDRICLNHFLVSGKTPRIKDIFACHEYSFLLPIYYAKENNFSFEKSFSWVKKYKPNFFFVKKISREKQDTKISLIFKEIIKIFWDYDFLEKWMKTVQLKKIKNNPKTKNKNGIIIACDDELAFWPEFNNQGPKIWEDFIKRKKEILD